MFFVEKMRRGQRGSLEEADKIGFEKLFKFHKKGLTLV